MILIIVSLYSFLGNSALVGPSVYLEIYSKEFGISVTEASGLVSYPNLVFGFGMSDQTTPLALTILTCSRFSAARSCLLEVWPTSDTAAVFTHGKAILSSYIDYF